MAERTKEKKYTREVEGKLFERTAEPATERVKEMPTERNRGDEVKNGDIVNGKLYYDGVYYDIRDMSDSGGHIVYEIDPERPFEVYASNPFTIIDDIDNDNVFVYVNHNTDLNPAENTEDYGLLYRGGGGNKYIDISANKNAFNTFLTGEGNDTIIGGGGDNTDELSGIDRYVAGGGHNTIIDIAGGWTKVESRWGDDVVITYDPDKTPDDVFLRTTADTGEGDDYIFSGFGHDTLMSGGGDDTVHAGAGNDFVAGGGGNDFIYAGAGNDEIRVGAGTNYIDAGEGDDAIILTKPGKAVDTLLLTKGEDVVVNFSSEDIIDLGALSLSDVNQTVVNNGLLFEHEGGSLLLQGLTSALDGDLFI